LPLKPRRVITRLKTCAHGGFDHAELKSLGIDPRTIIDFSISTNPFMPPPGIRDTLNSIAIDHYPDSQATELREKLAMKLGISGENILPGNGTTELIRLAALSYFRRNGSVLILEPTYGEYEPACMLCGAKIIRHRAIEETGFSPNMDDVVDSVHRYRPRGIFICNPNNPTGKYIKRRDIERVLDNAGNGLLILDEAYVAFVEKTWNSLELIERDNVLVLRSMTKDYGIPGLRLGYAVAHRAIIENLRLALPPWNVNIAAQTVGMAVLDNDEYLRQSLVKVREAKRYLTEEISRLGLEVLPSDANYFLVKVGNGAEFRRRLLEKGIQVRDCASFGLAQYIRLAPRTIPECRRLIDAIEGTLKRRC
jgi:histidinol-phosphate aminotransferase